MVNETERRLPSLASARRGGSNGGRSVKKPRACCFISKKKRPFETRTRRPPASFLAPACVPCPLPVAPHCQRAPLRTTRSPSPRPEPWRRSASLWSWRRAGVSWRRVAGRLATRASTPDALRSRQQRGIAKLRNILENVEGEAAFTAEENVHLYTCVPAGLSGGRQGTGLASCRVCPCGRARPRLAHLVLQHPLERGTRRAACTVGGAEWVGSATRTLCQPYRRPLASSLGPRLAAQPLWTAWACTVAAESARFPRLGGPVASSEFRGAF